MGWVARPGCRRRKEGREGERRLLPSSLHVSFGLLLFRRQPSTSSRSQSAGQTDRCSPLSRRPYAVRQRSPLDRSPLPLHRRPSSQANREALIGRLSSFPRWTRADALIRLDMIPDQPASFFSTWASVDLLSPSFRSEWRRRPVADASPFSPLPRWIF
jgi:hypothetical protein